MRNYVIVLAMVMCSLASAVQFPAKVDYLNELSGNEEALTAAIREFDQKELAYLSSLRGTLNAANAEHAKQIKDAHLRIEELKDIYETALILYPENARLHNFLGELEYDYRNQTAAALKEWNKALQLDPKYSTVFNNMSLHYFHIGDYDKGLKLLDEAIRLDKKHPDYMYNMIQMYLIHWKHIGEIRSWSNKKVFREAMKMSKKLIEMQPNDFHIRQDYANNFYSSESMEVEVKWKDAAEAWSKARELAKSPEEIFYTWLNEARTWIKDKNTSEAGRCLNEASQIRPDSPVVKSLSEQIGQGN